MLSLSSFRSSAMMAALLVGAAVLPTPVHAQPLPTAAQVIDKHVAAVGGRSAFEKLTSLRQVAQMEMPAMGLSAETDVVLAPPNKMTTRINMPQIGEMVTGTNGEVAWSVDQLRGPRLLENKELAQILDQADFLGALLFLPDRFSSMTNEGIVDFNGEKAYKIRMVRKSSGTETTQYFSVASGLNIGNESTSTTEMGTMHVSTLIKDYKEFGGLRFPTRSEANMGPQTMVLTIKDVQLNGAPADAFAVPAAVQPLIKK